MAIYWFTGKLGSGKTLVSIGRIHDYLRRGSVVATNIDLRLDKLIGKKSKKARVIRVPDKPEAEDLENLGNANITYDEKKNGLLVLDECGTWFNSRTWNDKHRQKVIDWFLHARKKGWDIIFIVQDISMVDKQAREALGELVGYCRRGDRIPIPFLGRLFQILGLGILKFPKFHYCIVKYGVLSTSLTVENFIYRGSYLFDSYDTKQAFIADYPHGTHSLLPPWYRYGRFCAKRNIGFYMRLTKIIGRRFSRITSFAFGFILTSVVFLILIVSFSSTPSATADISVKHVAIDKDKIEFLESIKDYKIISFVSFPGRFPDFVLSDGKKTISTNFLMSLGYKLRVKNNEISIYFADATNIYYK